MAQSLVLGIDPGLNGALAFYDTALGDITVFDMPTERVPGMVRRKNGLEKGLVSQIDLPALARILDSHSPYVTHAAVEQVNSMPGQGIATTMKLGVNYGIAIAMVAASFIPLTLVRPRVWKKAFGLSRDKKASRVCAARLLPNQKRLFGLGKDDGRAEAALIALWMWEKIRGDQ